MVELISIRGGAAASNINELLTPIAIAYWISSYGHYHKRDNAIIISTESLSVGELDLWRSILILLDKYGIETTRHAKNQAKEQYYIRIPKREVPKVKDLVKDLIPSTTRYRIGL